MVWALERGLLSVVTWSLNMAPCLLYKFLKFGPLGFIGNVSGI